MEESYFKETAAGRVVQTIGGFLAFVPANLPPFITYDAETVLRLSEADTALAELSGLGRILPNPHLLIAPLIRREAVLSSRIEGTQTSFEQLLKAEADDGESKSEDKNTDLREVRNYVVALEHGLSRLPDLPLSLRLVRELHAKLMHDVRGETATPGEFRHSQNWIGAPGSTPASARYVPPPPDEMSTLLNNWENYMHEHETAPTLVQCAIMHQQFEALHPFLDGNGRVGRLLITLFLVERGRLSQPLLYLSDFFGRNRTAYYDQLLKVSTDGAWTDWIRYFLVGVRDTAIDASFRARKLLDMRESLRTEIPEASLLVDRLFINPYTTIPRAARVLGVTDPTATKIVGKLETLGHLTEISGRRWRKTYLAEQIMDALNQPVRTD